MEEFHAALRYVHVTIGFVGLAAFWVPAFAPKGRWVHVFFGRIFEWCVYIVTGSAILAVIYRLGGAMLEGVGPADDPASFGFLLFLGYLAVVTLINTRFALSVVRNKQDPDRVGTRINMILARVSIVATFLIVGYALYYRPSNMIILLALSPIGWGLGRTMLKYMRGERDSKRQWLYEHLGGMLGAGIAFHTAFAVFGASQLFDLGLEGWVAAIPWVTPVILGISAIVLWTRHYQRKFGEVAA